ncbi:MAG: hypothetical protein ACJA0S_000028 [Rickettsiales bacterium]|jgi:uncharacterized protein YjbI with pentapeptide repeats
MTTEKKEYISLEDLMNRGESNLVIVNMKFFALLKKHKNGQRDDFVREWNEWVEKDDNKYLRLDFSDFHFDINNEELKEVFSILMQENNWHFRKNCWHFNDLKFPSVINFSGTKFSGEVDFACAEFMCATFEEAIFLKEVTFYSAKFSTGSCFDAPEFKDKASFFKAKFSGEVRFIETIFNEVDFHAMKFDARANFSLAEFNEEVSFFEAKFASQVDFLINKATEELSLLSVKFDDNVYFNEEFLSQANLAEAFIDITKINFIGKIDSSRILNNPDNYRIFRRYYANKLDHELERKYFALELESKPFPKIKKIKKWSDVKDVKNWLFYPFELIKDFGYRIITLLYKWTSDYGNSIFRPIIAVLVVYLFTILTASDLAFGTGFVDEILGKYSKILLTHIPFGYSAGDSNIYKYSNDWMKFLNGIIMYVGLFLMGLAARNRFRIK